MSIPSAVILVHHTSVSALSLSLSLSLAALALLLSLLFVSHLLCVCGLVCVLLCMVRRW